MKNLIMVMILLGILTNAQAYTQEDWRVYNSCKERVNENVKNGFDSEACKEMLDHKSALRKYGAEHSYKYWIKRLGK